MIAGTSRRPTHFARCAELVFINTENCIGFSKMNMKKGDERNSDYGMHAEPDLVLSSYVRVIVHLGMFSLLQPESSTKRLNQSGHRSQLERNPGAPKRRGHGPLLLAPPARGQRRDPLQRRVPPRPQKTLRATLKGPFSAVSINQEST